MYRLYHVSSFPHTSHANHTTGQLVAGGLLFRLAKGRVPLVRIAGAAAAHSGGVPTLRSYVGEGQEGRLQQVEAAWRRAVLRLAGPGGTAFRRALAGSACSSAAATATLVCTAPACGLVVKEEDGGLAALRTHVKAVHAAGAEGGGLL